MSARLPTNPHDELLAAAKGFLREIKRDASMTEDALAQLLRLEIAILSFEADEAHASINDMSRRS